jgi:hypothetical protein
MQGPASNKTARRARARRLIGAVRDGELAVDDAVLRLSQSHRWLAPLAFTMGAVAMLFEGLRLLLTNWRLALIQILPAVWIWAAMLDLKAHAFRGRTLHVPDGAAVILVLTAIVAITAASFFLNAVFAFAVAGPRPALIRPAFARARSHLAVILASGAAAGVLLGLAAVVFARWGPLWFTISLSIVIGVMMICYVAVPARLIGLKTAQSRQDKLAAIAVGCAVGAVVCTPPYILGRVGLLMLGSGRLFAVGVIVFTMGLLLEAAATSAVKAIKMSAKLMSGQRTARGEAAGVAPDPEIAPLASDERIPDSVAGHAERGGRTGHRHEEYEDRSGDRVSGLRIDVDGRGPVTSVEGDHVPAAAVDGGAEVAGRAGHHRPGDAAFAHAETVRIGVDGGTPGASVERERVAPAIHRNAEAGRCARQCL